MKTSSSKAYEHRTVHSGHNQCFDQINWSSDGTMIGAFSKNGHQTFWDVNTGTIILTDDPRVDPFAWLDNKIDRDLGGDDGLRQGTLSHSHTRFAFTFDDSTLTIADLDNTKNRRVLRGHTGSIFGIEWSHDDNFIASASADCTVGIWDSVSGRLIRTLEGHSASVVSVSWSATDPILASKSLDGTVRLWRTDIWEPTEVIKLQWSQNRLPGLSFHPRRPWLAVGDDHDTIIHVYGLFPKLLLSKSALQLPWSQYTNAKIVLVGDSSVGKSGLSLVLTRQPYKETDSTHGRHVYAFETSDVEIGQGRRERREALLWDLAGQPGYRLIHQLHLSEVTVALIVFDARSETDPFSGVRHWTRALNQAQSVLGASSLPLKKFLVAARVDRGGIAVSEERINALLKELKFDGYFKTSARQGWEIAELSSAIRGAINWDSLPKVHSSELFQDIKDFLLSEKEAGRILSTKDDLYHNFISNRDGDIPQDLRQQFDTCIGRVESRDLIRRLRFGGLVLLQPEMLDAYASAIVEAAKEEPDGLGSLLEEDAHRGQFRMSSDERLQDKEQEQLLTLATVEDMLAHEIALREMADDGVQLVFPSQFMRENPELPDPEGKAVIFTFEGAVSNVYATLAVRLSHSGLFIKDQMWRNAATFTASVGGSCGMFLKPLEEGKAEIALFFGEDVTEQVRYQFEEYARAHLTKRAIPETVKRRKLFTCPSCNSAISEKQAIGRKERGHETIICPVCDTSISLFDEPPTFTKGTAITAMDKAADIQRDIAVAAATLRGKIATKDFDTLLAHHSADKDDVEVISSQLKMRGLYPWIDKEQIPPGTPFQDSLQDVISKVKSATVIIGPKGLGRWEEIELRSIISQCVSRGIPVIPVLLPGVDELPPRLLFLKEMNYVQFSTTLTDAEALDRLQWGITQHRPAQIVLGS